MGKDCEECGWPIIGKAREGLCQECWEMSTVHKELKGEKKRLAKKAHKYRRYPELALEEKRSRA